MYIVYAIYPTGKEARLEYATLDEALQKLRDLAEADEIDTEPQMVRYALELEHIKPKVLELHQEAQANWTQKFMDEHRDDFDDDGQRLRLKFPLH